MSVDVALRVPELCEVCWTILIAAPDMCGAAAKLQLALRPTAAGQRHLEVKGSLSIIAIAVDAEATFAASPCLWNRAPR